MHIAYYPGCTLKTTGINFEKTTLALLQLFNIHAVELEDWYCCGVMYSQTTDNLMHQLAPVRTLIKAKESGSPRLLTLCSMCYNTLKRTQRFLQQDEEKQQRINSFLDREIDLRGDEVEVIHLFNLLEEIGVESLREALPKPVDNLRVASYYGCLLTRPKEVAIVEEIENPTIMETLLEALGCRPVYFQFKTECCASFQIVNEPDLVKQRTQKIITAAVSNGAEILVLSCPLCRYNLDALQQDIKHEDQDFQTLPVLYFTQLMALAYGIDPALNDFSLHHIDPRPVLEQKGLL